MKKILLYSLTVFILFGCGQQKQQPTGDRPVDTGNALQLPEKPNILWIVAEDLSPFLAAYGDSTVSTPNLDRLAREGVRYDHVYSTSGVCAPSRSTLATGMYPISIGTHHMRVTGSKDYFPEGLTSYSAVVPPEVKMHSEYLRRVGYFCTNNAKQDYQFQCPGTAWDQNGNHGHWRNRPSGKPFFSIFNFNVCHESGMWRRKDEPLEVDPANVPVPPYYPDDQVVREELARMYSNIAEMDRQIGVILDQLEADGLMDSTIIFFYGDHGGPLPRHKREIYDTGLRVPLFVRFPGAQMGGTANQELVSFVDFMPTLLSLAGIPIPDYVQGQAFLGEQKAEPREYIYAARDRLDGQYDMVRGVRDKRFKYFRNYQPEKPYKMEIRYRTQMRLMRHLDSLNAAGALTGAPALWYRQSKPEEELFDCQADPYELNNLAEDPQYAETLQRMRTAMDEWLARVGDKGQIPEFDMVQEMWPNFEQPKTETPSVQMEGGKVLITSNTEGASIGYKIKGQHPSSDWMVYTEPLAIPQDSLYVKAFRIGYEPSETVALLPAEQ